LPRARTPFARLTFNQDAAINDGAAFAFSPARQKESQRSVTTQRASIMLPTHSAIPIPRASDNSSTEALSPILHRLQTSSYLPLRFIHCSADGPRVILRGRVPSYYLKQLAQTLAGQCIGAPAIDNRLDVA
jgi:hypothetical protein